MMLPIFLNKSCVSLNYRAIYHGADIFLLDDVLSAVDAQVARWILYNAILGPLTSQQTRVLCTHNVQVCSEVILNTIMSKLNPHDF